MGRANQGWFGGASALPDQALTVGLPALAERRGRRDSSWLSPEFGQVVGDRRVQKSRWSRYRKVTACARLRRWSGENVVGVVPVVTPVSASQVTASA